ncbi:conserved protein of unknown function [Nitrospira japonica]|uniref:Uncharacterized protein n=1 Tax=Nitrospira japonica TaxID=1325564 RepID=A0A1W1I1B3_9BACT|nr:conserved protein of unknown function [Nitrospira japonica]
MSLKRADPCSRRTRICEPLPNRPATLEQIVAQYISAYRSRAQEALDRIPTGTPPASAVEIAVWAGKADHQRRLSPKSLSAFQKILLGKLHIIQNCANFDELHRSMEADRVHGVGKLAIYDIALLLGRYWGYLPERVYLHRGTRRGAKALSPLGVDHRCDSLTVTDFPTSFHALQPYEIEDCLCIYEDHIKRIVSHLALSK